MPSEGGRAEMNPVVTWVIIAVVVLAIVAVGYKFMNTGGSGEFKSGGSEAAMEKVKTGGKLYEPPAAALPPAARQKMGGGGGPMGGYNLKPPDAPAR